MSKSNEKVTRRGFLAGLTGIGIAALTGCGEAAATNNGGTPSSSETPVEPSTPSSPESTANNEIKNSNLNSVLESDEYRALSPEEKAVIDEMHAIKDLYEYRDSSIDKRFAYSNLIMNVYGDYAVAMLTAAFQERQARPDTQERILGGINRAKANISLNMTGEDIILYNSYATTVAEWATTKNGNPTIIASKLLEGQKVMIDNNYVDSVEMTKKLSEKSSLLDGREHYFDYMTYSLPSSESEVFYSVGTSHQTKVIYGPFYTDETPGAITLDDYETKVFKWYEAETIPSGGQWVCFATLLPGNPDYLDKEQTKDTEAIIASGKY